MCANAVSSKSISNFQVHVGVAYHITVSSPEVGLLSMQRSFLVLTTYPMYDERFQAEHCTTTLSGPYAGGVRGVRTNRPLSGRGPRGCMRLHGAWLPCMAVASCQAVVGFKLVRLLSRAFSENGCPPSCKFY